MSQPFLLLSCAISSLLSHFAGWHLGENPKPFHHHLSHRKCVLPQWGVKSPFCRKQHLLEVGKLLFGVNLWDVKRKGSTMMT